MTRNFQFNDWIVMLERAEQQLEVTTNPSCRDKLQARIEQLSCIIEDKIPSPEDCPF